MVVNQRARRYTSLTWKVENAMERLNVIQTVVDMTRAKTYLEIGVASGAVFFRVKARQKIAVDARLRIFVLDCDTGVGIITRGSPDATLDFTKEQIDRLSYDGLKKNGAEWLNVKKPHLIRDLLARV